MSEHEHLGVEDHDRGLSHDLPTIFTRRRALGLMSAAGLATALAACGGSDAGTRTGAGSTAQTGPPQGGGTAPGSPTEVDAGEIPEETGGPFPGDGSNGVNVLTQSGIVRSDIRTSFGTGSATAAGVPLEVTLTVVDVSGAGDAGAALAGAAVYIWQCDADGGYSLYSDGLENENYLRGVQEADRDGRVTFTSIFPAAYRGRWPHIHFEIYPTLDDATSATNRMRTSQLAFPQDVCDTVYTDASTYPQSASNMLQTPLDRDNVFSDGYSLQMATVTGSVAQGYVATLRVPV